MQADRLRVDAHARSVGSDRASFLRNPRRLLRRLGRIVQHSAVLRARHQRAIRKVPAIGERLAGGAQADGARRLELDRSGEPYQDQVAAVGAHRLGDGARQRAVLRCPVVERAVRLDVREPAAAGADKSVQRGHLVEHERADLIERQVHGSPAEVLAIRVARVCADGHVTGEGEHHRPVHDQGATRVHPAGDVRRREEGEDGSVVQAFADIRVQVHRASSKDAIAGNPGRLAWGSRQFA